MRRRAWFTVHRWLGLTCGLLLFVVCWSGTVAVFAHEIDWLLNPRLRAAPAAGPPSWQAAAEAVETARPGWRIVTLSAPLHDGFAMEILAEPAPGDLHRVYYDPTTDAVTGWTSYFNVQRFFRSFHMAFFDGASVTVLGVPPGYLLVAVLSFPLLALAVTPLVFYRRWWRGFVLRPDGRAPVALWSGTHKLLGVWSLWFVAVIGLTGSWYLVEWYVPYAEPAVPSAPGTAAPLSLDALVERARAEYPALRVTGIALWNEPLISVEGQDGSVLVRDRAAAVTLDRRVGTVIAVTRPGEMTALARWTETADPLHFGTWAGLWSKALYFAFGLALSALALTGAYLHARRGRRDSDARTYRAPVLGAHAVTVGAVAYGTFGALREIRGYGLDGQWPAVDGPVLAFVGGWCLLTVGVLTLWMWKLR